MDLRLIAFDLDGTLLRSDKSISPRTMHALHAAQERGVLLVPATGRLYRSLPEALLDEQLSRYFILVNGAQVYDASGRQNAPDARSCRPTLATSDAAVSENEKRRARRLH